MGRYVAVMAIALCVSFSACAGPTPTVEPTPVPEDELVFYDWLDDMPQSVLDAFAAEYGVPVRYVTYESMEEAIANIRSGAECDVVVLDNRFIPGMIAEGLLAPIPGPSLGNFKNLLASFRDLVYDPGNQYSIPYNWGTTGLVVRSDLVGDPVTRWADLWDSRYRGKIALWRGESREVMGLALKSLGYSANSEDRDELEAAVARLIELKPYALFMEDFDVANSVPFLESGEVVIAMGWAYDVLQGRESVPAITYVLPEEGAMVWGENFCIPRSSTHPRAARLFLDFVLRPEIAAQIANANLYATPNEAAHPLIDAAIRDDPVVMPSNDVLRTAELVLPLSPEGQRLHEEMWERFLAAPVGSGDE